MKPHLILPLFLVSFSLFAADCPWLLGRDLTNLVNPNSKLVRTMTMQEQEQDLACLRFILKDHYVAQRNFPNIRLLERLETLQKHSMEMTNAEFRDQLFYLHEGMVDLHLKYSLGAGEKKFLSNSKTVVKLDKELAAGKIHKIRNGYYFRPGSLLASLTAGQRSFVNLIKTSQVNAVLDLRNNGGGEDAFAFALAEALYTKEEAIPKSGRFEIFSPLKKIGFQNSLEVIKHPQRKKHKLEIVPFLNIEVAYLGRVEKISETHSLTGQRAYPFRGKLVLLTDAGCASSCETVVEKLSVHPNVQVVGASTHGALHYSNPITFVLPRSGIQVMVPTLMHQYENDAPEGWGYFPDVEKASVVLNELL